MDKIHTFLIDIGIPVSHNGFNYLHDAIEIVNSSNSKQNIKTCDIYRNIADEYKVKYMAVERCIRHSTEICLKSGDPKKLEKIFGEYNVKSGKLKNADFIAICALHLK